MIIDIISKMRLSLMNVGLDEFEGRGVFGFPLQKVDAGHHWW